MKRLITSMLVALCLQAIGQYEYCLEGTAWSSALQGCVPKNPSDLNQDGCVGLDDFLGHLAAYGEGCVDDGDDGSCEYPSEFNTCGDPVYYHGYNYATVLIGDRCWFAENLRSANYKNGDAIPALLTASEWQNTTSGAVAIYGEGSNCSHYSPDGDACDAAWSLNEYGRLYNWYAVDDARGLCPSGWHVPSDSEWTVMKNSLGGWEFAGSAMKTTYGWLNDANGSNESGFAGLPGGFHNGGSLSAGKSAYWWTSSLTTPSAPNGHRWYRRLTEWDAIQDVHGNSPLGLSVRCIQDAE